MSSKRWWRVGTKVAHELASITFGGALAACLVINAWANPTSADAFMVARQVFNAIARYLLIPSMAVVVVSGLLALAATRAYLDAGWAWLKTVLGLSVFEATLVVVGAERKQAEFLAAAGDPAALEVLLRAERQTLWLLVALSVANVVLAVWRPRLTYKVR